MQIQMVIWFVMVSAVLFGGYSYLSWRLIKPARLSKGWKWTARIALAALLVIPVTTSILQRSGAEQMLGPLVWVAYVGLGLLSSVFTFVLLRDIVWMIVRLGKNIVSMLRRLGTAKQVAAEASADPSRESARAANPPVDEKRRLLLVNVMNAGILGVASTMTAYGVYEARRRPAVVEVDVPITHLPPDLEGFRIVQLSDIHVGLTVKQDFVETIAGMADELRGDMLVITGDLADGSVRHLRNDVAPLGRIRAPHGRFFVTGNHEYYSGHEQWIEEADRLGYSVLVNGHQLVEKGSGRLLVAGVTDYSGGRFSPEHESDAARAVAGAPAADTRILLAHQPRSLYNALPHGFDLQLSGHTHGGQFFPWNLLAPIGQPYLTGLNKHDNTWVYVSRGTGYWGPPVRIAARSEITVLRLVAAHRPTLTPALSRSGRG